MSRAASEACISGTSTPCACARSGSLAPDRKFELYKKVLQFLDPPAERVEIPYEQITLPLGQRGEASLLEVVVENEGAVDPLAPHHLKADVVHE